MKKVIVLFSFLVSFLFLFSLTTASVLAQCEPGSVCGSGCAQTCPTGECCCSGNAYCVWAPEGNYCGGNQCEAGDWCSSCPGSGSSCSCPVVPGGSCFACGPQPLYFCCGGNVCDNSGNVVETCSSGCSSGLVCGSGGACNSSCECCCPYNDAWCNGDTGPGDPVITPPPGGGERIIGRTWKPGYPPTGTMQSGYSITSSDGKTANWLTDGDGPYYEIGRWTAGSVVQISIVPDAGYLCHWDFDNQPGVAGGESSGDSCTATVSVISGPYSPDSQNHLTWYIIPPPPPTCTVSVQDGVIQQGQSTRVILTGDANTASTSEVRLWIERQDQGSINTSLLTPTPTELWPAPPGTIYYKIGKCDSNPGVNSGICSVTIPNLSAPMGNYYLHCDVPSALSPCSGNPFCTHEGGSTVCAGWQSCSNQDNTPFTVTAPGPWFSTQGGDVHAQGNITSSIPSTATNTNFSRDLFGYPGLVSLSGTPSFGNGSVSTKGWVVEDGLLTTYSFDYFRNLLDSYLVEWDGGLVESVIPPAGETRILYTENPVRVNSAINLIGNRKLIILVGGATNSNVNINNNINVEPGSFLAIFAQKQININSTVTNIEGLFFTDGHFSTGSGANPLNAEGVFFIKGNVLLQRNLGNPGNSTTPSEVFIARPDMMANIPIQLLKSKITWREVAP